MKKLLVLVFFVVSLTSCQDIFTIIREPDLQFNSWQEANEWVYNYVYYKDKKGECDWQPPQMTIERRSGNCVDFCIFVLWYADKLGHDAYMRGITLYNGVGHAILVIDGVEWEPQTMSRSRTRYRGIIGEWTLEEALEVCYHTCGNRAIILE